MCFQVVPPYWFIARWETGHAFYDIGFENIRIQQSTRYRIRCGFIFFNSGERIYFFRIRCRIRRIRMDGVLYWTAAGFFSGPWNFFCPPASAPASRYSEVQFQVFHQTLLVNCHQPLFNVVFLRHSLPRFRELPVSDPPLAVPHSTTLETSLPAGHDRLC